MSEPNNNAWPFAEMSETEGLNIAAIFGSANAASQVNPFEVPVAAETVPAPIPATVVQEASPVSVSAPELVPDVSHAVSDSKKAASVPAQQTDEVPADNPIAAAFEQKTVENARTGLLEKPPVFYHKGVKEEIEDPSMTFEELRIRKAED